MQNLTTFFSLLLLISCQTKFKNNNLLFAFTVKSKSTQSLYHIKNFEKRGYIDKPRNLNVLQKGDTLLVTFEVFEGAAVDFQGNIEIKKDSLFLKIGRGAGIRELVINEYEYKINNPEKRQYQIEIKSFDQIKDL